MSRKIQRPVDAPPLDPWVEATALAHANVVRSAVDWLMVCEHFIDHPNRDIAIERFVASGASPAAVARVRQRQVDQEVAA